MAPEYFNHHATRTAIEVSVQLDGDLEWAGTGFFIKASKVLEEGARIDCLLLVSNKHVLVEGAGNQLISLNRIEEDGTILYGEQESITIDRSTHRFTGHADSDIDLACLDMRGIETGGYDVPTLPESFLDELDEKKIGVGSEVLYAGYPNGMKDKVNGLALMRKGSIASVPSMDCDGKGLIAIDGTVLSGNSGGPAFVDYANRYRLLGVMYAKSTVAEDYGFAIKQKYVRELVNDALEKSANELREIANKLVVESLLAGEFGGEVRRIKDSVWARIASGLDRKRKENTRNAFERD